MLFKYVSQTIKSHQLVFMLEVIKSHALIQQIRQLSRGPTTVSVD